MVYKISIREAGILFDTGEFKHGKRKAKRFINDFNSLFNKNEINANFYKDVDILRLSNKITELKAIYYSLIYGGGENAKKRFFELFGHNFSGSEEDIILLNNKAKFFIDKLNSMPKKNKDDGVTFNDLVAIIENSRGITIDREMKVFEFYRIYDLELKKWQT